MAPGRARGRAILVFAVPLAVYLAGMRYVGSGDTEPAELLPISLLTEGNLDFNEFVSGADVPYAYRRVGGRVVSTYPIVAGLLNVPVYAAARAAGVDLDARRFALSAISASLMAALSVLFLFFALRPTCASERQALFFAFVYAFGTCVWSVASRGLWQHTPSLLFLSAAFWLLLETEDRRVALAGLLLGLAVASRPTNILLAAAGAAFVLIRRRRALPLFVALALVPAALVAVYSKTYLGDAFAFGQLYRPGGFGRPHAAWLLGLLVSPSRGLFFFSPFLLAGVAGGFLAWRRFRESGPLPWLAAGAVALLVLYSCWGMWWGGAGFGYRLLLEIVPVLILLMPLAWNRWFLKSRALRAAFFVSLGFSIYVQFLGAHVYPSAFGENLELEPSRLWDVRDSELVLCTRKLLHAERSVTKALAVPAVWWTPEENDDSVPGWLDASPGGGVHRGPLEISGWAKSRLGNVDVRVVLDDGRIVAPERFPRPDVARIVPELGDTSRAGFRTILEPRDSAPADHALAVELRDPRGAVRRLGPIRFRWAR